jgi:23S rRNA (cytidine1920-2'-O)/16S rRNA (cytidine1409-2'-O)-methyltransferase
MRADQWLVTRGLAASRSQAQRLLESGARWRPHARESWRALRKSDELSEAAEVELTDSREAKYVSRGGLKLEGALAACGVSVAGLDCLDIGQSTGGFTDCLLQHGAARVVGVDVGRDQLHAKLRSDPRVTCIENINARSDLINAIQNIATNAHQTPAIGTKDSKIAQNRLFEPAFACMDVSFISQSLLLSQLALALKPKSHLLALVKPQFELQPSDLGKGGIVRDASLFEQVETKLRAAYAVSGFEVLNWLDSPIEGGDGNREFFIHALRV